MYFGDGDFNGIFRHLNCTAPIFYAFSVLHDPGLAAKLKMGHKSGDSGYKYLPLFLETHTIVGETT